MSDHQCSAEEDEILRNHDDFLAEPTLDGKVLKLGENFRDGRLATVRSFADLRHLLPWRPWMLRVIASVGVLGVVTLIWAASAFNKDVQANKKCAEDAKQTALEAKGEVAEAKEEFTAQLKPVSEASVAANAKLDMLLEAKGMSGPSRNRMLRSAAALGLPADSVKQDSAPLGPR